MDVRDPRGLALMHRLADGTDVFVENYRPEALDKLGLGYESLSERNPRLVYCSISAYGHSGPDADNPGFGLIAEAKGARPAHPVVPEVVHVAGEGRFQRRRWPSPLPRFPPRNGQRRYGVAAAR